MLIGKIDKALEPSPQRPIKSLGKQHRQDREEHRGASRGTGGNGFLTTLIAGSCWQLKDSHFKPKVGGNVDVKVGVNYLVDCQCQGHVLYLKLLPASMTRQQGGLGLDYVQFGCVVQLGELAVSRTRQQGGLNLDYLLDYVNARQEEEVRRIRMRHPEGIRLGG